MLLSFGQAFSIMSKSIIYILLTIGAAIFLRHWLNIPEPIMDNRYAVVLDAGSTGTRMNVFSFSPDDGRIKLTKHSFLPKTPGLSSFPSNPQKVESSIDKILTRAEREVPLHLHNRTPLALWATAGLRILPEEQVQRVLDIVKEKLDQSPFSVKDSAVQVIDGDMEGFFAWMTVNYLLDSLSAPHSYGILDLGGASVQIAFEPLRETSFGGDAIQFEHQISVFEKPRNLYIHSYENFGLMSARFQILRANSIDDMSTTLESSCLPPSYTGAWKYANKNYTIKHVASADDWESCSDVVRGLVTDVHRPNELQDVPFLAMSYIFDRAADVGMLGSESGGVVAVGAFREYAKAVCERHRDGEPFLCIDLIFISSLLLEGFGFSADKQIHLEKNIDGVETSWALGAAFHLLEENVVL